MKYFFPFTLFCFFSISLSAQIDLGPINFWNGEGHFEDNAAAIGKDASGNIYVAGSSVGAYTDFDIVLIKYSSAGVKLWEYIWDDPGQEIDQARALYVDSVGNAYVTGITRFYTTVTYYNIVTMKFDPNGNLLWDHVYNGTTDNDYPNDITVDQSGNVYVVGDSKEGPSGNRDFITLKYSPAGTLLWDRFYNGTGSSLDYARGVCVNQAGDVFVTGEARNASINYDITTVKYNSAGVQQWADQFNGMSNASDFGRDILTGPDGSIYVAGSAKSGSTDDITCIKYNPVTGNRIWEYMLSSTTGDGARIIQYSAADTSLVIGGYGSGFSGDFLTVKIDTAGNYLWHQSYSSGNLNDYIADTEVDGLGNVYTGGRSSIPGNIYEFDVKLIKYDKYGNQQWVSTYDEGFNDLLADISIQNNGEPAIATSSFFGQDKDIHTIRYSTTGNLVWRNIFKGEGLSNDLGAKMTLDSDFNQIVIGSTNGAQWSTNFNYVIIKMDSLQNELWYSIYDSPEGGDDYTVDVITDTSNNIYVTGYTEDSVFAGSYDITTIKYGPQGNILWTHTYVGSGGADDIPSAIALDSLGNIFVSGTSVASGVYTDVLLLKYDSNGNLLGDFLYNNNVANYSDISKSMAIDSSNNVYIVGATQASGFTSSNDYLTLKFDNNGNLLWEDIIVASGPGYATEVVISEDGFIFVGGNVGNETSMDLIKYDGSGNQVWVFNEPAADSLCDMVFGPSGDLYLTARKKVPFGSDIETFKITPNGQLLWLESYSNNAGSDDTPFAIALDPDENVIVVGTQEHLSNTNFQAVLVQYDSTGNFMVERTYESVTNWRDAFTDVECLPSGRVLVTGQAYEEDVFDVNLITYRFDIMATSFVEADPNPRLARVNPNNNQITIRNYGATQVDLTDFKLASEGNQINQLSSMTVLEGSLIVPSLGEVVITGLLLDVNGGDLALYQPAPNFNNTSDMVDFMQWSNGGNPWQSAANINSYWFGSAFVGDEPTYVYIGNGLEYGVQYWEGFDATISSQMSAQCESNCNGAATVSVSGGLPPFTYLWDASAGSQTTATATGLCAGTYSVIVTDFEGNQTNNFAFVGEDFDLSFSPEVFNENCNSADGSIIIHPSGGSGNYSVTWSIPGTDTIQTNLSAGTYIAIVTDSNTCVWNSSITILENAAPALDTMISSDPLCFEDCNGTVSASATGNGPLTYVWDDPLGSTSSQVSGLCAGTYTVEVSDSANCLITDSITIVEPLVITTSFSSTDDSGSCDGTASVMVSGGTPPYTYLWDDPNGQVVPTAVGLCEGTYSVVIADSNDCLDTITVNVLGTSGVGEQNALNFRIYPNPFTEKITIEIAELETASVNVIDVSGKLIKEVQLHSQKQQIDLKDLLPGVYIIRLITNEHIEEIRLVKL